MLRPLLACSIALLLSTPAASCADDETLSDDQRQDPLPEATFAEELSVSAPFRAEADTPVPHTDLDAIEIESSDFGQEPSFLLSRTPSITHSTDSGGIAGYTYFRLRGIDQTRINMTLDGVPLNEPEDQGVYFSNYPDLLNSVSSIQIQRGTGTTSNGVASYAGSILFETPSLNGDPKREFSISTGSENTRRAFAELSTNIGSDSGIYLRASRLTSDGFKEHSANQSGSIFYSLGRGTGRRLLKLTGFTGHQENQLSWLGVPLDTARNDNRANGNTSEETDRFSQSLTMLQYSVAASDSTTISTSAYFNLLEGDYDFDLDNFLGLDGGSELYNYDFRSRFLGIFATATHTTETLEWSGGVHLNRYRRRHRGSERDAGRLYENTGFKNEEAAFVKVTRTLGEWLLFGDLQYRRTSFEYRGSVDAPPFSWSFLNPRLGASRRFASGVLVYYSIGKTGREPTRNDLFGGLDDLGIDESGNPQILTIPAESVVDQELGLRSEGNRWSVDANLFWMKFENEITLNGQFGPNGLALHSNVARSYRAGIEVDARYQVGNSIRLVNSSAFSRCRTRESGVEFEAPLSPHIVVNQSLLVDRNAWTASLTWRFQGSAWIDLANTVQLPAFSVLDASGGLQLGRLRLELNVLNLFDRDSLSFGSIRADGIPIFLVNPPRSAFLGLRWTL